MKIKVLIAEHSLPFYHVPAWELLGSHPQIELTVAYGQGFFTGEKYGVPEGVIPTKSKVKYIKCSIAKNIFGFQFLWNSASIKAFRNNKFDVIIHQAETKVLSLALLLSYSKIYRTKFALWGIGNPLKPSPLLDYYRNLLARLSNGYIFYSESNKQKYLDMGISSKKLFVAKNSINVAQIIEYTKTWGKELVSDFKKNNHLKAFTFLSIGRMIQRKQLDWLLMAGKKMIDDGCDIQIVIIGNGEMMDQLVELSQQLNIQDKLVFTGKLVGIENIGPWFMSADVVVAPSQVGHLATESHAYGKPIILSNNKSLQGPESEILINEETGLLYKHGDIDDLSSKMTKLYLNPNLKSVYFDRCQQRAEEFASTSIMVNGFINAIETLSNNALSKF